MQAAKIQSRDVLWHPAPAFQKQMWKQTHIKTLQHNSQTQNKRFKSRYTLCNIYHYTFQHTLNENCILWLTYMQILQPLWHTLASHRGRFSVPINPCCHLVPVLSSWAHVTRSYPSIHLSKYRSPPKTKCVYQHVSKSFSVNHWFDLKITRVRFSQLKYSQSYCFIASQKQGRQ